MTPKQKKKLNVKVRAKQLAALAVLREGLTVREAAKAAYVSLPGLYSLRQACPEFAAEWDDALKEGTDTLIQEAVRRGREGRQSLVVYMGRPVIDPRKPEGAEDPYLYEHKVSDPLLMFILKARDPYTFCDRARTARLQAQLEEEKTRRALAEADETAMSDVVRALETIADQKRLLAKPHA